MKKFLSLFVALAMVLSLFAGIGARTAKAATATYTVAASVTAGSGIIAPQNQTVVQGFYAIVSITATAGSWIKTGGLVDNVDGVIGAANHLTSYTYTTTAVTANRTIAVTFEAAPTYTVAASVYAGSGTIYPPTQTVAEGLYATVTMSAATGYRIATGGLLDSVDGVIAAANHLLSYIYRTITAVAANRTIGVTFELITPLATADLSITKTVDNAAPLVGSNVTFTLTATNRGPETATSVTVNDTLPAGLTYVSSTPSGAYNSTTHVWTVGTLTSGASAALSISATVTQAGAITNTATVTGAQTDSVPANNTAQVSFVASGADLSITKTVDNATPLVGSNVTFTLTVRNSGTANASSITVADTLPAGLTYVSSTPSGAYDSTTHVWTVGTLANGASTALSITATVTQAGAITNTATVTGAQTDSVPANNTASAVLNPIAPPLGLHLNPLALPLQICRESEVVVDESWTDGTAPFTWTVSFGDGTPAVTGTSTDRRLVVRHLYAAEGTYAVSVTVTDSTGKTGSASQTLKAVNCNVPDEVYHHTFLIGYPDGMFKPERNVSRAEVATALSRALGLGWSDIRPSYPDVPATHWAAGYIQIMVNEGIMIGDTSGTFRPDAFITRAEAAAVLLRTLKVEPFHNLTASSFNDVPAAHWALGYIESMQKYGLITGYPDGTYKPDAHILRSEFTAIADRALGREISASSQVTGLGGDVRWPDVPASYWAYLYILEASTPHTVEQANRLNRSIVLKSKTIPLFSDGTSAVTIRKVGDILTAIVPVDGLRPDGSAPVARKVTVVITTKLVP